MRLPPARHEIDFVEKYVLAVNDFGNGQAAADTVRAFTVQGQLISEYSDKMRMVREKISRVYSEASSFRAVWSLRKDDIFKKRRCL